MQYTLQFAANRLSFDCTTGFFAVQRTAEGGEATWNFDAGEIVLRDGDRTLPLTAAQRCTVTCFENVLAQELTAVYEGFVCSPQLRITVVLSLFADYFDVSALVEGDNYMPQGELLFPPAVRFGQAEEDSYTLLSKMQGMLIPAGHPQQVKSFETDYLFDRNAYMPFYALAKGSAGLLGIWHTPYDTGYRLDHPGGSHTYVQTFFRPQLGRMTGVRTVRYQFVDNCSVMAFAKAYRVYADRYGRAKTLKEKAALNPAVRRLYGTPVVHSDLLTQFAPGSVNYIPGDDEHNIRYTTFERRAQQLEELYAKGVKEAYLHFDGWVRMGYDSQHPDVFPPNEICGGLEGMKKLSETAHRLGYVFGIHDQYRDYYVDAPSYVDHLAQHRADGTRFYVNAWNGGEQTFLCSARAMDFVKRNFDLLEENGVGVEAAYLDVFNIVELDECIHPLHSVTREQCAVNRRAAIEEVARRGIIVSSEEGGETMLPVVSLCHHVPFMINGDPFFPDGDDTHFAPAVPLMAMVYHDCMVMPWIGISKTGGFGLAKNDIGLHWAILTGSPVYYDIDETEENIEKGRIALELHRRLAEQKIVDFGFVGEDWRHQFTVFEDGTRITVQLDSGEYTVQYPEETAVV